MTAGGRHEQLHESQKRPPALSTLRPAAQHRHTDSCGIGNEHSSNTTGSTGSWGCSKLRNQQCGFRCLTLENGMSVFVFDMCTTCEMCLPYINGIPTFSCQAAGTCCRSLHKTPQRLIINRETTAISTRTYCQLQNTSRTARG